MDAFADEAEANITTPLEDMQAALQAKTQATQQVALQSLKCFPFFLPRLSNLLVGMAKQVEFIWIGHYGGVIPLDGGFLKKYGWLLSNDGTYIFYSYCVTLCPNGTFGKQYIS